MPVKSRNLNPTQNSKTTRVLKQRTFHQRKRTNSKRPDDVLGLGQKEATPNQAELKVKPSHKGRGNLRKMTREKHNLEKVLKAGTVRL